MPRTTSRTVYITQCKENNKKLKRVRGSYNSTCGFNLFSKLSNGIKEAIGRYGKGLKNVTALVEGLIGGHALQGFLNN